MAYLPPQQQQGGGYPNLQGAVLSEQLEFFISCRNLPKLDLNSPSDPFVVISQKNEQTGRFMELTKTEAIQDNNNPEFSKQIIIEYRFEEVQFIKLDIYDADSNNLNKLSDHDYIGHCEFVLADLVTADGCKLAMKIKDKKNKALSVKKRPSVCVIRSEEIQKNNDDFVIKFEAKDLPKMSWMSKANPYLQLYRKAADGGWMSVFKTKTVHKTLTPKWSQVKIAIQRLCNGDYSRPILIRCFHDKDKSNPELIGECTTSLQELLDLQSKSLINAKKKKCGSVLFPFRDIIKKYSFLEFIMGGMQVQMLVAIDFTGSNGDPRDAKSLHYIGPPKYESPYMRALRSVGRVVEPYDSDGQIGAYGFGANINPWGNKQISHCFNLTLNPQQEEVPGIEGVLQAYTQCLNKIQLYGPTYFSEIIQTAAVQAMQLENSDKEQNYIMLLIITDGIINDMQKTIDTVVNATELPLSIIIVGVGDADFSAMDKLDADDVPLKSSKGVTMKRDIVQFVPYNEFQSVHISLLAKEVLEEVPRQITSFMQMKKLHPMRRAQNMHMKQQSTMANLYDGPSNLVRQETKNNKNLFPEPGLVQSNTSPSPSPQMAAPTTTNPYYGGQQAQQPQVVYVQAPQYGQAQAPPQYGVAANAQPPVYGQQAHAPPQYGGGGVQVVPQNPNYGHVQKQSSQYGQHALLQQSGYNPASQNNPSAPTY